LQRSALLQQRRVFLFGLCQLPRCDGLLLHYQCSLGSRNFRARLLSVVMVLRSSMISPVWYGWLA
jgi:hypothetical protein